jgi:hypothetical protein
MEVKQVRREQLQLEIDHLKQELATRRENGRPLPRSVLHAYQMTIAKRHERMLQID